MLDNLRIMPGSRDTTFIRQRLTTLTSAGIHTMHLLPVYGGHRRVLLSLKRFLLAASGSYSQVMTLRLAPTACSLFVSTLLLVPATLCTIELLNFCAFYTI
jgi:hypothetical protein